MKSPELQQLTASEPLTLEQEYDMQRSWREDSDSEGSSVCKIFNIFNPPKCSDEPTSLHNNGSTLT